MILRVLYLLPGIAAGLLLATLLIRELMHVHKTAPDRIEMARSYFGFSFFLLILGLPLLYASLGVATLSFTQFQPMLSFLVPVIVVAGLFSLCLFVAAIWSFCTQTFEEAWLTLTFASAAGSCVVNGFGLDWEKGRIEPVSFGWILPTLTLMALVGLLITRSHQRKRNQVTPNDAVMVTYGDGAAAALD